MRSTALIIMSGIGIRAMDLVAIMMFQRLTLPFWLCKGVLEAMLLMSGWLMDGPRHWNTLVSWSSGLVDPADNVAWYFILFIGPANYGLGSTPARLKYYSGWSLQIVEEYVEIFEPTSRSADQRKSLSSKQSPIS
jgi:hypothetical protein